MRYLTSLLITLATTQASAITWDFGASGTSMGWLPRMSIASYGTPQALRSEVVDGVWRVSLPALGPDTHAALEVNSPRLGHDSGLFDRVEIRLRVLHEAPVTGRIGLWWRNELNQKDPYPSYETGKVYSRYRQEVYTGEWQELSFRDLRPRQVTVETGDGTVPVELAWAGELYDVTVIVDLGAELGNQPVEVEIASIRLTGVQEQLQGELDPPEVSTLAFGNAFEAPLFSPLGVGVGFGLWAGSAALGDLDGDGWMDLLAPWGTADKQDFGWLGAFGDGTGAFGRQETVQAGERGQGVCVAGGDLDGDGRMEGILSERQAGGDRNTRIYRYDRDQGWVTDGPVMPRSCVRGVGNADGDGNVDAWVFDLSDYAAKLLRWNEGGWEYGDLAVEPFEEEVWTMGVVTSRDRLGLLWHPPFDHPRPPYGDGSSPMNPVFPWFRVTYLEGRLGIEGTAEEDIEGEAHGLLLRQARDLDGDGDTDLITAERLGERQRPYNYGIGLQVGENVDGRVRWHRWLADAETLMDAPLAFADLDADGVLDVALCDVDPRATAVVVATGPLTGRPPASEGRYPIVGWGGPVLPGDVDNDGDVDLVVLERSRFGEGGVHTLLNRLDERDTAVLTDETAALPESTHLGAAYPNPFNPSVTVTLHLPRPESRVTATVYNLLGQPVATVMDGPLAAGNPPVGVGWP